MTTALIQLDNGTEYECSAWVTVSSSSVVQVVVSASSASITAQADAHDLHTTLLGALRNGGARPDHARCGGSFGPGVDGCWASSHPGSMRRVLVWVSDGFGSPPSVPVTALAWDAILTLLPNGTPPGQLPPPANHHVVRHYRPGTLHPTVAADVLSLAGIGSDAFRLFISYRHGDSARFADQLFDALSHEQFDVYLDRFRTPPGTDFVDRIRYELANKACVVILDSEHVAQSDWVRGEYAFARRYRLGLMAIDLPGGGREFAGIRRRLNLATAASSRQYVSHGLPVAQVETAVEFIKDNYFAEIGRRPRYQRRLIQSAASLVGVPVTERADAMFDTRGTATAARYLLSASARPPVASSFRRTHEAATSGGAKAVVIGPLEAHLSGGRQDVDWLAATSGSVAVDERRLFKAMRRIGQGRL